MNTLYEKLGLYPFGAVPSPRQLRHLTEWNQKAFFHFGVNTFSGAEWGNGSERESLFDPSACDVRQWIKVLKASGFSFAILTVKHHDGFCLWPSRYTEHSVKQSPYQNGKGDLVKEFTDACHEFGIACGLYISPWDRNSPYWKTEQYNEYFNNQLTELLTQYGRIDEIWWDGAGSRETKYDRKLWVNTIRKYQPDACIFGSLDATPFVDLRWVGTEGGYAGDPHYPTVDPIALEVEDTKLLNSGSFGGARFIPAEVDVSIRPGWFYHESQDGSVKSVSRLVDLWFDSIGRSAMMLLNFPPDKRGLIHKTDAQNAIEAHRIIRKTFAVNLAADGRAVSDSVRDPACEPDLMLCDNDELFYAAKEDNITPVIEIILPKAVEFDTVTVGEKIDLGLRVKEYKIEAYTDGAWKELCHKHSLGQLWAERFEPVTSDRIRLTVLDAAAAPVLRHFGLYKLPYDFCEARTKEKESIESAQDLVKLPTARIHPEEQGVRIEFGGIYPFNTLCFNGTGISHYHIYAFNGSDYYLVHKGYKPSQNEITTLPQTVRDAYQLRLVTFQEDNSKLNLKVLER